MKNNNTYYDNVPLKPDESRTDLEDTPRREQVKVKVYLPNGMKMIIKGMTLIVTGQITREKCIERELEDRFPDGYRKYKILKIKKVEWES